MFGFFFKGNSSKFHIFFQVSTELTVGSMRIVLDSSSEILKMEESGHHSDRR